MKLLKFSLITPLALAIGVLCTVAPLRAEAAQTTISATIAPVRIVTVDTRGAILSIQSNTDADIAPTVQQVGSNKPATLTRSTEASYHSIIKSLPPGHYGTVYRASKMQLFLSSLTHYVARLFQV